MIKQSLLLIADDESSRLTLANGLRNDYHVIHIGDMNQALENLLGSKEPASLVIMDMNSRNVNAVQLLDIMKKKEVLIRVPVLLITENLTNEMELNYYEMGITDFINRPFEMKLVKSVITNTLELYRKKNALQEKNSTDETNQASVNEKCMEDTLYLLGTIAEYRNMIEQTVLDKDRAMVELLAAALGEEVPEYEITKDEAKRIAYASLVHDIGKLILPDSIRMKPGLLSEDEQEVMKSHASKGAMLIKSVSRYMEPEMQKYCYDICRSHHERHDGAGYPDGLKGTEIPVAAQIVSIIDAFSALLQDRPHRKAFTFEKAYIMIIEGECGVFSPQIISCFKKCKESLRTIHNEKGQA